LEGGGVGVGEYSKYTKICKKVGVHDPPPSSYGGAALHPPPFANKKLGISAKFCWRRRAWW